MATKAKPAQEQIPSKARIRLSPEVRRRQILDAALIEFSSLGFAAASISKIATRADTSKANLYVHFANKDEIFETLLKELLSPPVELWPDDADEHATGKLIDDFIEKAYSGLTPQVIAVIRLIIAESHRVPGLIQRWHDATIAPARAEQQRRIDQYASQGKMPAIAVDDYFSVVMAPILCAAIVKMVFNKKMGKEEYLRIKEGHRKVLHLLLNSQSEHSRSA